MMWHHGHLERNEMAGLMANVGAILLVEDSPNDASLFCRAFKSAGFENVVKVARTGEEAIEYLKGEGKFAERAEFPEPQLVFLDLKLPGMSGLEVLWVIRQKPEWKHLPVVVLTTSAYAADVTAAYRAGANSFLTKPLDLGQFVEQLKV